MKILTSLWPYYRDEPALNDAETVGNFPGKSASFKFKQKITDSTEDNGVKNVEIMVPLKYSSNFWRTLEMPLIISKTDLTLTWSQNCVISNAAANLATTFAITNTKLYVPV